MDEKMDEKMDDVYKMDDVWEKMFDVWWMMFDVIPLHLTFYIYELTPSPTPHNQHIGYCTAHLSSSRYCVANSAYIEIL